MINPTDFTRGFALLQDRWERQLGKPTIAEYHRILNAELSTEEFNAAVQIIFRQDTFWPSPQRFIEAVRGDPKAASEEAWNALLAAAAKGDGQAVTPEALATLRALGVTFREVGASSEYQLTQLGKRFRAHHERAAGPDRLALEESPAELELRQ